jgi:hypothetical protein
MRHVPVTRPLSVQELNLDLLSVINVKEDMLNIGLSLIRDH